ncbi:MAG: hypothetical protein WCC04_01945 [Terriglobales bacterium]
MPRTELTQDLAKLVYDWCAAEQIAQLLRDAKDTSDEVRVSAPKKETLIEKNLRDAIESGAIPLDKVYDLIREAEENGNQHIFYYRRSGQPGSLNNVATRLWGAQWEKKMDLPRADLVENDLIFADLHPWNADLKPHDWVLKIYGHEFTKRYTDVIEKIEGHRFKHEFFEEPRRLVIVVRWNNPGILEVRIPQTASKKRVNQLLQQTWLMIAPACPPTEFEAWKLTKARGRMIAEQKTNEKIYRLNHTRLEDEDHNVGTFECHDPQGNLFSKQKMVNSVQNFIEEGECKNLRVLWFTGNNPNPSRELHTLIGHNETNEIVIGGYCQSQDVDYVTDQLRHFSR